MAIPACLPSQSRWPPPRQAACCRPLPASLVSPDRSWCGGEQGPARFPNLSFFSSTGKTMTNEEILQRINSNLAQRAQSGPMDSAPSVIVGRITQAVGDVQMVPFVGHGEARTAAAGMAVYRNEAVATRQGSVNWVRLRLGDGTEMHFSEGSVVAFTDYRSLRQAELASFFLSFDLSISRRFSMATDMFLKLDGIKGESK